MQLQVDAAKESSGQMPELLAARLEGGASVRFASAGNPKWIQVDCDICDNSGWLDCPKCGGAGQIVVRNPAYRGWSARRKMLLFIAIFCIGLAVALAWSAGTR